MKSKTTPVIAVLLASAGMLAAETKITRQSSATAEATAEVSSGDGSKVTRKSVTVTSDGDKTIRKTVTVIDGKEEVVTEITDADGKVTRTGNDGEPGGPTEKTPGTAEHDGAWLGVHVEAAPSALRDQLGLASDEGVVVDACSPDGPAAKAGIRTNDLLLALDEARLSDEEDLRAELKRRKPGDTVSLEIMRKGQKSTESVTLGERRQDDSNTPAETKDGKKTKSNTSKVEIHIDGNGGEAHATAGDSLDSVLDDPNVPDHFKKTVREMKQRMEDMEKKRKDMEKTREELEMKFKSE